MRPLRPALLLLLLPRLAGCTCPSRTRRRLHRPGSFHCIAALMHRPRPRLQPACRRRRRRRRRRCRRRRCSLQAPLLFPPLLFFPQCAAVRGGPACWPRPGAALRGRGPARQARRLPLLLPRRRVGPGARRACRVQRSVRKRARASIAAHRRRRCRRRSALVDRPARPLSLLRLRFTPARALARRARGRGRRTFPLLPLLPAGDGPVGRGNTRGRRAARCMVTSLLRHPRRCCARGRRGRGRCLVHAPALLLPVVAGRGCRTRRRRHRSRCRRRRRLRPPASRRPMVITLSSRPRPLVPVRPRAAGVRGRTPARPGLTAVMHPATSPTTIRSMMAPRCGRPAMGAAAGPMTGAAALRERGQVRGTGAAAPQARSWGQRGRAGRGARAHQRRRCMQTAMRRPRSTAKGRG